MALVKFDPYIPQCIQFGRLLDPNAQRFAIKGAPQRELANQAVESPTSSAPSVTSLQIKPSRRQLAAHGSLQTDSPASEGVPASDQAPVAEEVEEVNIVKDSFVAQSSDPPEPIALTRVPLGRQYDDALMQAIKEAKATAHLPLDEEDEGTSPAASFNNDDDDSGTDDEPAVAEPKVRNNFGFLSKASALRDKKSLSNQDEFRCMQPSTGISSVENPNARTIQILEEMGTHYDNIQDTWRTLAYRKAVSTLKKQTTKITTAKQARKLPSVGPCLADKIGEIVLTNRLRKLDNTKDDPLDSVLRLFLGVYGVGVVQAGKWVSAGHRTLEDLTNKAKLTDSHKIGIEHYRDFNSRIPRSEVASHGAYVRTILRKIDPKFTATVMGSYRRGATDSGDIDIIISCPGASLATLRTVVFDRLIPKLYDANFLKASLASRSSYDSGGSKWHGASCLPSSKVWRRMDFLLVPEEEMGAALIYFTGNDIFNRSIRLLARKKGMRLNQKGLYKDFQRGKGGVKLNEGTLVEGRNEKRIFEILGVPWREPHERIC